MKDLVYLSKSWTGLVTEDDDSPARLTGASDTRGWGRLLGVHRSKRGAGPLPSIYLTTSRYKVVDGKVGRSTSVAFTIAAGPSWRRAWSWGGSL